MSDFERFREMTFVDSELRRLLLAERDMERFIALVVRLAAERGCKVPASEVQEQLRNARRSWLERQLR